MSSDSTNHIIDTVRTRVLAYVSPTLPNWFVYPNSFDVGATWLLNTATIGADATTAPDGTATADKLIEASGAGRQPSAAQAVLVAGQPPPNSTACCSAFFKAGERSWARLRLLLRDGSVLVAYFNLATGVWGTVDAGATVQATSYPNSWYRLSIGANVLSGGSVVVGYFGMTTADATATYTGDGASGLYLWGARAEAGLIPPPYLFPASIASLGGQVYISQAPDNATGLYVVLRKINTRSSPEYSNLRQSFDIEAMCFGRPRSAEATVETIVDVVEQSLLTWQDGGSSTLGLSFAKDTQARDTLPMLPDPYDRELVQVRLLMNCVSWARYYSDALT